MPQRRSHPLRQTIIALALFVLLPLSSPLAQSGDAKGSKDNPLIKRYEGSTIIGYDARKLDEFDLVLGPLQRDRSSGRTEFVPTKSQRVEGRVTRIMYTVPEGRSPLEVVRNYELELQKSGFQTLYKCARDECGEQDGRLGEYYLYPLGRRLQNTPPPGMGRPRARSPSMR